jgi:hypothetical protein
MSATLHSNEIFYKGIARTTVSRFEFVCWPRGLPFIEMSSTF